MESKTIILVEFPAPCNMKCEYCYIKPGDKRRKPPYKVVTADDFRNLACEIPTEKTGFHFCSIGDPILYPGASEIFIDLSRDNSVVINANMLSAKYEELLKGNTKNIGIWFSIHWKELLKRNKILYAFERMKRFISAGITVWPMTVLHPAYYDYIDDILVFARMYDIKIKLMHYRDIKKSTGKDGLVIPPDEIMQKLKNSEYIDWSHWDESFKRWDVKGRQCSSGIDFLVINSNWKILSCGGAGNIEFGIFPEDIKFLEFKEKGICESDTCPCSWAIFHGICEHPRTLPDVLSSESGKLKVFYGKTL